MPPEPLVIVFDEYGHPVALPISKQQFNKLGERIAVGDPPAKEDLAQLNQVLRAYQAILDAVEEQLAGLDLPATTRVKTRAVLIEKLRREHGMLLARVQDLAGARIVIDGGWIEQDRIVEQIVTHFGTWAGKTPRTVDRRVSPSHGYRAVHVIVFPEGVPVEIQVRTELQNYWAQIVERLADRWGRGIRYGADPEDPQLPAEGLQKRDGTPVTRGEVITLLRDLSVELAGIEVTEREMRAFMEKPPPSLEQRIAKVVHDDVDDIEHAAALYYALLRKIFKSIVTGTAPNNVSPSKAAPRPGRRRRPQNVRRRNARIIRRSAPDVRAPTSDFVREKMAMCDKFIADVAGILGSRLNNQHATLRKTLQTLTEYVDKGGIR